VCEYVKNKCTGIGKKKPKIEMISRENIARYILSEKEERSKQQQQQQQRQRQNKTES